MISIIVPVYRNAENISQLLHAISQIQSTLESELEAVFVVDGSPDDSYLQLASQLPDCDFSSKLLLLSRNFGSFAAIRAGLEAADGDLCAVMAADLQEPLELIPEFESLLRTKDYDVVIGERIGRRDPAVSSFFSRMYWSLYRRFIQPEMPPGGVDIFACNRMVRDQILMLKEGNSSLIGLVFWIGFRRASVEYKRNAREVGRSAWTLKKKMRYLSDSTFSFSNLPILLLLNVGIVGMIFSIILGFVVVAAKLSGNIPVPGYAANVIVIMFFGGLNCFGFGIVGSYVWRTYENTKNRPNYIVASTNNFSPRVQVAESEGRDG